MSKITKENADAFRAGMNSTTGAKVWNGLFGSEKKKKEQEAKRKREQHKLPMTRF